MNSEFYYQRNPDVEHLFNFQKMYESLSGTKVSIEYLKNADTYCFYSGPNLVGGFVLSHVLCGNRFRYFSIFEENAISELEMLKKKFGIDEQESLEVTCVCMKKKVVPKNRAKFYQIMILGILQLVKEKKFKYLFGGSTSLLIQRFQSIFLNNTFYLGITPKQEGGALKHIDGSIVQIYFIKTSDLKIQALKLILHLQLNGFQNKFSKLIYRITTFIKKFNQKGTVYEIANEKMVR